MVQEKLCTIRELRGTQPYRHRMNSDRNVHHDSVICRHAWMEGGYPPADAIIERPPVVKILPSNTRAR